MAIKCIAALKSAIKGSAPVVAIPVEGHAPACVDRKRLATWSKGVEILSAEIRQKPNDYWYHLKPTEVGYVDGKGLVHAEGPQDIELTTEVNPRWLCITGRVRSKSGSYIKTTCKMALIDRRTAVKTLADWSTKERAKIEKKLMLGALSKETKKKFKLAKFEDSAADMIDVLTISSSDKREIKKGSPVSLAGLEMLSFGLVAHKDVKGDVTHYSINELTTGLAAGQGNTAEAAMLEAMKNVKTLSSPEKLSALLERIAKIVAESQQAEPVAA